MRVWRMHRLTDPRASTNKVVGVCTFFGPRARTFQAKWALDSGASAHMTYDDTRPWSVGVTTASGERLV